MGGMKNRFAAWGIAVAILALVLAGCSGSEERQMQYLEQAQKSMDEEDYDTALIDVKNALQINPNNAQGRYMLGIIEGERQEVFKMIGNLRMAVDLDPTHIQAAVELAQLYTSFGRLEEAREYADIALTAAPNDADALGALAIIEMREGNHEAALDLARRAIAIAPANTDAVAALVGITQKEDPEGALEYAVAGLASDPENSRIRLIKIRLLERLERLDDVIAEMQVLIDQRPNEPKNYLMLSAYYKKVERPDEAEAVLRRMIEAEPDGINPAIHLSNFLVAEYGPERGIEELEHHLALTPKDYELRRQLAARYTLSPEEGGIDKARQVYLGVFDYDEEGSDAQNARLGLAYLARTIGDLEEEERWTAEVLELEPDNGKALVFRASRLLELPGNHPDVILDMRTVLRSQPQYVPALMALAKAQEQDRSNSLALDTYRKVLALSPDNTVALYNSARLYRSAGKIEEATKNLEHLLKIQPNYIQGINLLAEIYSSQERWDEARQLTQRLAEDARTRPIADYMGASLALRQGSNEEAIELANSALEQQPRLAGAVPIVAQAYVSMKQNDKALAFVTDYLEEYPESASTYDVLARLYLADKQIPKAIAAYEQGLQLDAESIDYYLKLASLYRASERGSDIEALFKQGISENPRNSTLRIELANLYQQQGDYDRTLETLEEALKIDEKSPAIANNLAVLLIDHFPSEPNMRRAQELTLGFDSSRQPPQLDTLGWLQYKLGNTPQAISLLKSAQRQGGQGPDYWYHLGMAYYANEQMDLAREQLGKALENEDIQFFGREEAEQVYKELERSSAG